VRRFDPLRVHVVQFLIEGPLKKSLIVGAVLGVALFQFDSKAPQGMVFKVDWTVPRLQWWPDPLNMYVALPLLKGETQQCQKIACLLFL
jgi:hypothetical protein